MYAEAAQEGFAVARRIYTGKDDQNNPVPMTERYKSSNKLHLAVNSGAANASSLDWDDGEAEADPLYQPRLTAASRLHGKERIAFKMTGDFLDQGCLLRLSQTQALNCWELAAIGADVAYRALHMDKRAVALAVLSPPADHAFAVVGQRAVVEQALSGRAINDLDKLPSPNIWIVDPWLNLCRRANYYGRAAANRLMKWQQDNKRIAWSDGPEGPGWYSPIGAYSAGFNDATIALILPN